MTDHPLSEYIDLEAYDVVPGPQYRKLLEQLEVLREFYDAWWAHENGIVDFDLHHSQVERLRAAANAAFRLTHPPDSGSAVAPAEGSRDQASGSPTPNPASGVAHEKVGGRATGRSAEDPATPESSPASEPHDD